MYRTGIWEKHKFPCLDHAPCRLHGIFIDANRGWHDQSTVFSDIQSPCDVQGIAGQKISSKSMAWLGKHSCMCMCSYHVYAWALISTIMSLHCTINYNYCMSGRPLSVNIVLAYAPLLSTIAHSLHPGSVCTWPTTDSIVITAMNFDWFRILKVTNFFVASLPLVFPHGENSARM